MGKLFKTGFISFVLAGISMSILYSAIFYLGFYNPAGELSPESGDTKAIDVTSALQSDYTFLYIGQEDDLTVPHCYILVRISPGKGKMIVGDIDKELLVTYAGKEDTLSNAYSYGGALQAVNCLKDTLKIAVDDYMVVQSEALGKLIDLSDGVDYSVHEEITQTDRLGRTVFKLYRGTSTLDGTMVLGYLRYNSLNDQDRQLLRLNIFRAFLEQKLSETIPEDFMELYQKIVDELDTSITTQTAERIGKKMALVYAVEPLHIDTPILSTKAIEGQEESISIFTGYYLY